MKTRILLLSLLLSLFTGCATNPQRTLAATQDVIYGAKKSWVAYCKAEYKRIDNLPAEQQIPLRDALAVRRARVHALASQIDSAWWAAWIAAKYDTKAKPSAELLLLVSDLKLAIAP
jgi:hypothetical protein